jgi:uncharacterized protein DUF3499
VPTWGKPNAELGHDTHVSSHHRDQVAGSVARMGIRRCSRSGCPGSAVATLTYVYADSTAVLGPLATQREPHCYDLCFPHAQALSVPRGWEVIRLVVEEQPKPSSDDLVALANAVREVGLSYDPVPASQSTPRPPGIVELGRRGHLTVLTDPGRGKGPR